MSLWNDNGIMALRMAVAIFQAIGLFGGLLLIARRLKNQNFPYLLLSALTLAVWMFPRHKLFDISLSILLIGVMVFLIQKPARLRYFLAGVCVGLAAVFGRNHGIYGVVASLGIMGWLSIKRTHEPGFIEGSALWASGVTIGFAPVLIMALVMPGFATAFWDSILFLFEVKATNLPLPIPWPWQVTFGSVSVIEAIRAVLVGLFFVATAVFGVLSIAWVVWQKFHGKTVPPVLVAVAFMAPPYAHYAYSRADVGHLAQGIFPLLIGCLAMLATLPSRAKWPLSLMLCCASLGVMLVLHPGWQCGFDNRCVKAEISGSQLGVPPDVAEDVRLLQGLADKYAADGRSFLATPFWPGAYPLLGKKSPMWAIYALQPRSEAAQREEIKRIKAANPGFILMYDFPLDGREELRFRNTHPLIHQFILDNFQFLPDSPNPFYQIFKLEGELDKL
jgi:hypothetical protein